jgi:3-mercaptopyruvate sulfurtransferase SseA
MGWLGLSQRRNVVNVDTQFQIAERAYFIWKQKGCPDGKALDNWLQAEAELSTAKTSNPATSAKTPQERRLRRKKR